MYWSRLTFKVLGSTWYRPTGQDGETDALLCVSRHFNVLHLFSSAGGQRDANSQNCILVNWIRKRFSGWPACIHTLFTFCKLPWGQWIPNCSWSSFTVVFSSDCFETSATDVKGLKQLCWCKSHLCKKSVAGK